MNLRKAIAGLLAETARRLYRDEEVECVDRYEHRRLGVGYHISKKDVVKFRKEHPEYKSHREGLKALVEDTKQIILGNIAAGIRDKQLIEYDVRRSFWTADVTGVLNVYERTGGKTEELCDGGEEKLESE